MLSLEDVIRGFASRGPTGPNAPNGVPTVPINGPWQYSQPQQTTPLQDAMLNGFGGYTGDQIRAFYQAPANTPPDSTLAQLMLGQQHAAQGAYSPGDILGAFGFSNAQPYRNPQQGPAINAQGGAGSGVYGPPSGAGHAGNINANGGVGSTPYGPPTSGPGVGGSPAGSGAMTFEQALATAQKMLREAGVGRGAGAALDAALGNAQRTAGQASNDARNTGKRTQSDDAILYGRLGNFIKGLAAGSAVEGNRDRAGVGREYQGLINTNTKNANEGMGEVNTELARLGITGANANAGAANDLAYVTKAAQSDKAGTLGNMRAADSANQGYFKDLRGNAAVQGTGLIAHSKQAVQDALAQIQTALQNQTASIGAQRGAASDANASQALQMAMQILQQNAAPKGLNPLQQSEAALNWAKLGQLASGSNGAKLPGMAGNYNSAIDYLGKNSDPGHLQDLVTIFNTALSGNGGKYQFNKNNLNVINNAVKQSIQSRSKQGYNDKDLATLMQAIMMMV